MLRVRVQQKSLDQLAFADGTVAEQDDFHVAGLVVVVGVQRAYAAVGVL